jgi:pimeloyl-ACP methyl ester carboxylesterase
VGFVQLRLVLHVEKGADGSHSATLDSIDQGTMGIPVSTISFQGSTVTFSVDSVDGSFNGDLNAEGTAIEGIWSQAGTGLPLRLEAVGDGAAFELRRPQNPVKPYPYREEEVEYRNESAGITLAATLTIPMGKGPFPTVHLITGSGAQDRDESLMGHRPFLVLADYLTRRGIAVLRADDRGVGKSGGTVAEGTTADFAKDIEAGVAYLQTRAEVDRAKIGLIGHSEGGVIAPMVAARHPDIAFIVMMAGTGVPGDEIVVAQSVLLSQAAGLSSEQAEQNGVRQREIVTVIKQEHDGVLLEQRLRDLLRGTPEAQLGGQIKVLSSPWYRYFLTYDPAAALRRVKCPVLAINGQRDLQVPPGQNLPAIRKALEEGGNKHFDVVELPQLNHLFQTAKTGAVSEYGQIEETIALAALELMAGWILKQ